MPLELINSSSISKHFYPLEEKQLGGNLIHPLLKDIAHHYLNENDKNEELLKTLIKKEEEFINSSGKSDMLFGIYKRKNHQAN